MTTTSQTDRCPWCRKPLAAGAVVCVECGFNRATGRIDSTAVEIEKVEPVLTRNQRWQQTRLDSFWETEIPIGLIAGSFLFIIIAHLFTAPWLGLPKVMLAVAFLALVEAAWMYAGMSAIELMTKMDYGPWRTAMLKLFSIASFWYALGVMFEWQAPGIGWTVHAAIGWPIEFFLIRWMFSLDSFQAMMTMIVVALSQWIVSGLLPG